MKEVATVLGSVGSVAWHHFLSVSVTETIDFIEILIIVVISHEIMTKF